MIKNFQLARWGIFRGGYFLRWVLIATLLWALFATATMFDILLGSCVLLGMQGLVNAAQGKSLKGWSILALAIGLGVLAKGPVILVHLLPVALLMPLGLIRNKSHLLVCHDQWIYSFSCEITSKSCK